MEEVNKQLIKKEEQLPQIQVVDPEVEIEFASRCAKALTRIINTKTKKVIINGTQYIEFDDWQTIARFYCLSVGTDWTKPIEKQGKVYGYEAKAVVYNQEGIIIGGAEASCLRDEHNWSLRAEFQLKSMAQTRASAKALRNVLGWVVVLAGYQTTPAEELNGNQQNHIPATPVKSAPARKVFYQKSEYNPAAIPE